MGREGEGKGGPQIHRAGNWISSPLPIFFLPFLSLSTSTSWFLSDLLTGPLPPIDWPTAGGPFVSRYLLGAAGGLHGPLSTLVRESAHVHTRTHAQAVMTQQQAFPFLPHLSQLLWSQKAGLTF